jgi:hypothetical protein
MVGGWWVVVRWWVVRGGYSSRGWRDSINPFSTPSMRRFCCTANQPTTNPQPRTTNHEPPTTNHQPRTTNHEPPVVVTRLAAGGIRSIRSASGRCDPRAVGSGHAPGARRTAIARRSPSERRLRPGSRVRCRDDGEGSAALASSALTDIRRDRHGCRSQLRREAETLAGGKCRRDGVDLFHERHRLLPHIEIAERTRAFHAPMGGTTRAVAECVVGG